ncbi:hypothetical protein GGR50DRAFT_366755 [Xylaria sp. CBS 124048]|nr:hypothetical protein GGR50DRAFT_366755 [Xylaria sp. CBS 124048]
MRSNMIHIRFHRRGPSNPTSPVPDHSSWDAPALQPSHLTPEDPVPVPETRPRSAASLTYAHVNPPVLPPITRVVSSDPMWSPGAQDPEQIPGDDAKPGDDSSSLPKSPAEQSSFIGGLALRNYRRERDVVHQPTQPRDTPQAPVDQTSTPQPSSPLPILGTKAPGHANRAPSFSSPTDLQNAPSTTKRLPSESSVSPSPPVKREPSKAKKTLPFLKNPMSSLLSRRKSSQTAQSLALPLPNSLDDPAYDPRIRGTRVHDFSAPRPWKPIVQPTNIGNEHTTSAASQTVPHAPPTPRAPSAPPKDDQVELDRTSSSHSKSFSTDMVSSRKSQDIPGVQSAAVAEDESKIWSKASSVLSKAAMSRNTSAASTKSAIPRHMKSTSSRFSFDMIGAAEQEKILEERHRQRQQNKSLGLYGTQRDSRFDEFDEFDEDGVDYDAMDHDDELEERIPGINADSEEDEFGASNDPDNDQENFAGFSFQRSNPTSALTTPHSTGVAPTPRDTNGHIMEESGTEEIPESELPESELPRKASLNTGTETDPSQAYNGDSFTGLGIQGLEPVMESPEMPTLQQRASVASRSNEKSHLSKDDELYFNDGLIHDFDGEGDGSAFDESIFDLNDTDRYGRPIPGMFADVLAQRSVPQADTKKRESDMTSRLSGQSVVSQSTAHTSPSADTRPKLLNPQDEANISHVLQSQAPQRAISPVEDDAVVAYQAALAAAAHKAAASGKFRRDSSPDPSNDPTVTSPTTLESFQPQQDTIDDESLANYEYDDGFSTGLDDYELDDDYITAEANASVLANDFDGWYGQEFGFYSAPVPQSSHVHSMLSEKNLYQYSNGGYFGPSGVNRSASGRLVSREPNLTPITERSEYSNRNSLMSNSWPPQAPNNSNTIQSPGLSQLAMMTEDQDMSLTSLLKLRNKAWGGSQASLSSSREGSPYERNGSNSPLSQELGGVSLAQGRNSSFSLHSQDSAGPGSDTDSPAPVTGVPNPSTNSIPSLPMSPSLTTSVVTAPGFSHLPGTTNCPPLSEVEDSRFSTKAAQKMPRAPNEGMGLSSGIPSQQRRSVGHGHTRSSKSISYVKEDDSGETRWILERRRTGESGEEELLERQVVGGGMI